MPQALSNIVAEGHNSNRGAFEAGGSPTIAQVVVDFGATPRSSARFAVTVSGATVGQRVVAVASADTNGDELEMDNLVCAGRVTATNTVELFVSAVPGPVRGQRRINVLVG